MDTDAEDNGFSLTELEEKSAPWFGLSFEELDDDLKRAFYEYSFTVRFLTTADEQEVRDMFVRLNRFLSPLRPQELRKARFTGPFIRLATELADDSFYARHGIVTPGTIRRMGDIEFVSELLAGCMYGPQDGSPLSIDALYNEFEQYKDQIPDQAQVKRRYSEALALINDIFPDLPGRWSNKHDFYSLFVAVCHYLREGYDRITKVGDVSKALGKFADDVTKYIENDAARVSGSVKAYARAVQKGPSSKARRAVRHLELIALLKPYFRRR
jgi:hypothetical protein